MMKHLFIFFSLLFVCRISAQESLIDTVFVDNQFSKAGKTAKLQNFETEKIVENPTSLSDLLRFQTNIYIKENGRGAVSSPSFRGTTAQQTAFVWNGINVNSIFLGQGDINNLNLLSYENIGIKFGGGSVIYGSGAIGGSVHLNNILDFDKGFSGILFSEIASFGTFDSFIKAKFSDKRLSFNLSVNHSKSENDYEVKNKYLNRNGQYQNTGFNLGIAYNINRNNEFYWQSQIYDGDQHYPIFSETEIKTKYEVQTFRSLIGWKLKSRKLRNDFKLAYLEDNFQYFGNIYKPKTSGGTGKQYVIKNDFDFLIHKNSSINFISEYQYDEAEDYNSGILRPKRNLASFALLFRHQNPEKFYWEIGTKKDFTEDYESPFLFSASGKYFANNWYQVSLSLSKNFRTPTFNDLYWQPGGNPDLKPEKSYQAENSNILKYKDFQLEITPYFMHIIDDIQWIPVSSTIWSPKNVKKVNSYGLETMLSFNKNIGNQKITSSISYTFSKSINLENDKQMMYVPLHKINFNTDYRFSFFHIFVQALYNGKTYTDEDENHFLKGYFVLNSGISATILKKYTIGAKVNNITNQIYETTDYYYMPTRNYAVNFKINF